MSDYIDATVSDPREPGFQWVNVTDQVGRVVEQMTPGRANAFGDYLKALAQEAWK